MKNLNKHELRVISGGSETIKNLFAWMKKQWCGIKNYEAPEKTWRGYGNHIW
ncbi:MAG: hypothetical protein RI573_03575 [Balneolaceae bacterium]|nr:hypothetical protein [Balneolaceae bacterium]